MQTTFTTQQASTGDSEAMQQATRMRSLQSGRQHPVRYKLGGFSLIELMVTVAIIAILAAIAIPMYQTYVRESRRTAARSALLDLASREEKFYSTNNAYDPTLVALGYSNVVSGSGGPSLQIPSSTEDYYNVTIAVTPAAGVTPASFIATAAAQPLGGQSSDSCGNYTLTDLGVQSVSTTATNCW